MTKYSGEKYDSATATLQYVHSPIYLNILHSHKQTSYRTNKVSARLSVWSVEKIIHVHKTDRIMCTSAETPAGNYVEYMHLARINTYKHKNKARRMNTTQRPKD